ncbi:V-type ATP synthase subunit E [Halococcus sediminicola]|uniref:V-type ATP synthase subunit E n=1 Tax=Halococcus sediminicola TaxID=1264579 RepID=UPI00067953CF|nr:V-type ATP synthase subunit E [Halococcus sediminicola]
MSLDTVAEDIKDDARERAERIERETDERVEEIRAEAQADADDILAERERDLETRIEQEREQKLSSAKLEAKQKRLEARRDSLAAVRERAESAVADISGDRREALTRELLDDAAREFDGGSIEVYGRADDADLIESILDDYEDFSHAGSVECLGGIVAENEASRVRVNNTFDSVFDAVWDEELKAVSDRLFDQ